MIRGHSKSCCISTRWLPKLPRILPSRRDYSSMSNPHSSGSIAIQSQLLSSEVKKMKGEEKDLIPRKCSTNLPARCRKTIGLPTGVLSRVSSLSSSSTSRGFLGGFFFSLNFHNQDMSKQHFAGGPLLCSLGASLHLSPFQKRGTGKSRRLGWRRRTPLRWGRGREEERREGQS